MGAKTGIEWTDATWSPIRYRVREDAADIARAKGYTSLVQIAEKMAGRVGQHCEHVSAGCEHCYAETNNHRCLPANGTGLPYDRRSRDLVETGVDMRAINTLRSWKRPRRIFIENQSDLFGEWISYTHLEWIFSEIAAHEQHTFQVLTKRPQRCADFFQTIRMVVPKNVWLGISAEDQQSFNARYTWLRKTQAAVRFLSLEPLLGPINLYLDGIDWVITGGESGPGARPAHPGWVRSIRDQCQAAGVGFFFKQWGEYSPEGPIDKQERVVCGDDGWSGLNTYDALTQHILDSHGSQASCPPFQIAYRVGKKAAGRLLDGRTWDEFPEVRHADPR